MFIPLYLHRSRFLHLLSYNPSPNCSLSPSVLAPFIWHATSYLNHLSTEQRWLWLIYLPLSWASNFHELQDKGQMPYFDICGLLKLEPNWTHVAFLITVFRGSSHEKSQASQAVNLNLLFLYSLDSMKLFQHTWTERLFPLLHGQHCLFFYTYLCYTFINCSEYIYDQLTKLWIFENKNSM